MSIVPENFTECGVCEACSVCDAPGCRYPWQVEPLPALLPQSFPIQAKDTKIKYLWKKNVSEKKERHPMELWKSVVRSDHLWATVNQIGIAVLQEGSQILSGGRLKLLYLGKQEKEGCFISLAVTVLHIIRFKILKAFLYNHWWGRNR